MTHMLNLEQFYQNTWCLSSAQIFLTVKENLKSCFHLRVTEQCRLEGVWAGDYGHKVEHNMETFRFLIVIKQKSGSRLDA